MRLLAVTTTGIACAELSARSQWQVKEVLREPTVACLAVAPGQRDTVYAAMNGGVMRSLDGGETWHQAGVSAGSIKSLAVSPHDPDTVYAGTKPAGVSVSRDGAQTWSELQGFRRSRRWYWFSPAEPPDWRAYVSAVSVSPTDPAVIVAGVEAGAVVRSEDGGASWSSHRKKADRDCHALTFHVSDGNWVYEAGGGGPAVSRDAGRSWRHPLEGLAGRYCMACAADPERPEVWYVAASPMAVLPRFWEMPVAHASGRAHGAIYRSSGGSRWEKLNGGLPQPLDHMAYALLTLKDAPGHLYAGLKSGEVWHSSDYGDSWTVLPANLGAIRSMVVLG